MRRNVAALSLVLGLTSIVWAYAGGGVPTKPAVCKYLGCKISKAFVCNTIPIKSHNFQYCFLSPSKFEKSQPLWTQMPYSLNQTIRPLLFFHGAGATSLTPEFDTFYNMTWHELSKKGRAPLPILMTYGPRWFLSRDPDFYSVNDLVQIALPVILAHIQWVDPAIRLEKKFALLGGSMGGHNTLQFYLNRPELVKSAAVFCSAIPMLRPGATEEEILAYIQKTHADSKIAHDIPNVLKPSYSGDEAFWRDHLFKLSAAQKTFPPLWVHYDDQDDFGFQAYHPDLLALLSGKSENLVASHSPGAHCHGFKDHMIDAYSFLNN